jgi:lysophospholipase L1-like esterase
MKKRLLFLGDSLIEYFDWEQRFPGYAVYNLGIAGETVEGLHERLNSIFRKIKQPDFVFIMTGINNLAMGGMNIVPVYRKIIEDIARNYPSARIFIHSLLPALFPFIASEDIRGMNVKLRHLSAEERVSYIDIHASFLDERGRPVAAYLADDGVHVSDKGYEVWSGEIERLLSVPDV